MTNRSAADDYPSVFRHLIERAAMLALAEAAQPGWHPHPDKQAQLLFLLANALRLPAFWPHTLPLLATLAPRMEQAGLREEWLAYLERGIACCDINGDRQTAAQLALERGILFERLGRLAEAQTGLAAAIDRFTVISDRRGAAKAHNRLAYVLRGRRAAGEAAHHIAQAQALLEPADPETFYCCMVLGLLAYDRHEWKAAEDQLCRCVDGWRNAADGRLYAMALLNLAAVYMSAGVLAKAQDCLGRAVDLLAALGDTANEALAHLNIGVVHLFLQEPQAAIAELLAAEAIFRPLQDIQRLALIYSNLALAHAEMGQHQVAEQHFEAALQRFSLLKDYPNWVDTLLDRGEHLLQHRQLQAALACTRQAEALQPYIEHDSVRAYQAARISAILATVNAVFAGEAEASLLAA